MKLTDVKGIGPATAESLASIGVETPEDLFSVSDASLIEIGVAPLQADEWRAQIAAGHQEAAPDDEVSEEIEAEPEGGTEDEGEDDAEMDLEEIPLEPEPAEELVELTFTGMVGRPDVGEVVIHTRRFRLGSPVRMTRADAEAIAARPQYEFSIESL